MEAQQQVTEDGDEILPALPNVDIADTNIDSAAAGTFEVMTTAETAKTNSEDRLSDPAASEAGTDASGSKSKYKSIQVNLLSGETVEVDCVFGRYTTGLQLYEVVAKQMQIAVKDTEYFGLWVVSASLQIQVKPHHLPFKIMRKWSEILESFASGDIYAEVPTLYLKRDALLHQGIERKVKDDLTINLLFDELAHNVAYSFYPCSLDEAINFAALALRAEKLEMATKSDMRDVTGCFLPPHLEKKIWGWTWRRKVWQAYIQLCKTEPSLDQLSCMQSYLEIGFQAPFYGATFFYGGLEHEKPGRPDKVVRVGVNLDGIHVIDDKINECLLSLPYDQFHYNSYESVDDDDSFLIEYDQDGVQESMIIWGPQSNIIDTLVTRHIEELEKWKTHLQQRSSIRKSYKPTKKSVKGRKIETSEERKFFTIGRNARQSTMFLDEDEARLEAFRDAE